MQDDLMDYYKAIESSSRQMLDAARRASVSRFVYAASTMGVTGTRDVVGNRAEELVARVRKQCDVPVCVGLGVSNGDQAAEVARYADGVIVGSALVRALQDDGVDGVRRLTADLAEGVRR